MRGVFRGRRGIRTNSAAIVQSFVNNMAVKMETVPISKFKVTCLALLQKVKRTGKPILVTRRGEPIAEVVPPSPPAARAGWLGTFASTGKILGDVVSPASAETDWEVLRPKP